MLKVTTKNSVYYVSKGKEIFEVKEIKASEPNETHTLILNFAPGLMWEPVVGEALRGSCWCSSQIQTIEEV